MDVLQVHPVQTSAVDKINQKTYPTLRSKNNTMELTKNQKIIATLLEKAWDDAAFLSELVANPSEVIQNTTGQSLDLPEGKRLVVVDQTDTSIKYLNIPAKPDMDEIELTDEQLELIAGGSSLAEAAAANIGN